MSKICIISTVKAPMNETLMFINYHQNIGVDRTFIFFDEPSDVAVDRLVDREAVTCIRCNDSYWRQHGGARPAAIEDRQVINNNNGLEMARAQGFDWAIFIDHDELVRADENLKASLSRIDADVVRFKIFETISENEYYDNIYAATLFKTSARSLQIRAAMLLGCRRAFFEGKYYRGHMDSKVALRVRSAIQRMAIHGPAASEVGYVEKKAPEIKLLHYDCVGFDAWKAKRLGRININSVKGLRGHIKLQQELFDNALRKDVNELRLLYRQVYLLPKYERMVLRALNMLKTIYIDKALFETPKR